LNHE